MILILKKNKTIKMPEKFTNSKEKLFVKNYTPDISISNNGKFISYKNMKTRRFLIQSSKKAKIYDSYTYYQIVICNSNGSKIKKLPWQKYVGDIKFGSGIPVVFPTNQTNLEKR
ncbi:MAG: hypothetical protein GY714_32160 [Desulfobacterales bacterium]|nr:hypothetical protein [Desulfobacterales bacterium]